MTDEPSGTCAHCRAAIPVSASFCAACGRPTHTATMALEAHELPEDGIVVGRDPKCDLVIADTQVSARHARIRGVQGRLSIEDLGSRNGTYVHGQRIRHREISFADDVRLGALPLPLGDPRIASLVIHVRERPSPGQPWIVGSRAPSHIVIEHDEVAPQHVELRPTADGYALRALTRTHPTYVDNPSFRVEEADLPRTAKLYLGSFYLPLPHLERVLEGPSGTSADALAIRQALADGAKTVFFVGRARECDLVLTHPTISQRHARLTRQPDGSLHVLDLGSTNGTFLDGARIPKEGAVARAGQRVAIGGVQLRLAEDGGIEGERASVRIDILDVSLRVPDRQTGRPRALLDHVSLSIAPGELVAMLGPSGAGKTTLLLATLGLATPSDGSVLFNGRPLAAQRDAVRTNVGYVPQDDIVHPQLTVREALRYACKLRLPPMSDSDREAAIERTLKQVGLWEQRDLPIGSPEEKVLSGGQRRRVNLAVELVADPALLILDEPTSGLSWTDAAEVVATLRKLADEGRTIVLTIHQPDFQEFEKFDSVAILARGGKLVFFGPPSPDSYAFFGASPQRPREIFDHVEQLAPDVWRQRFLATATYERFVKARTAEATTRHAVPAKAPRRRSRSAVAQFFVLLARSFVLTARQKVALILLLVQAPLLGVLIGITTSSTVAFRVGSFGCADVEDRVDACEDALLSCDPAEVHDGLRRLTTSPLVAMRVEDPWELASEPTRRHLRDLRVRDPRTGLLAMIMALFLPMVIASANTLVGERTIYERERLAGLRILPYVLARFTVLATLGAIVTCLHVAAAMPFLALHGGPLPYLFVGVLVTSSASALGLALSALVRSPVSALWGINFLVIPQLLFAGSIARLRGVSEVISWWTTSRWALEAMVALDLRAHGTLAACQVERYMENLPGFDGAIEWPILRALVTTQSVTVTALLTTMALLAFRDRARR